MSPRRKDKKDARRAQERARLYRAHQELHDVRERRRRIDNVAAIAVAVLVVAAAIVVQGLYLTRSGAPTDPDGPNLTIPSDSPTSAPPLFDSDDAPDADPIESPDPSAP